MTVNLAGLFGGIVFGFVLAWARVSDPMTIRNMLLLREPDVFLLMGSAVSVATIGVRALRAAGIRAFLTNDPIAWSVQRPQPHHIVGSLIFGAGWSIAGTCPGPVAAMIGEGKVGGLVVAGGLLAGVAARQALTDRAKRVSVQTTGAHV